MSYPPGFVHDFIRRLESRHPPRLSNWDLPRYDLQGAFDRELLATSSHPRSFSLGTGASIFTQCLIPAITSARHEVILVTCFWAPSKTLAALCNALTTLAAYRRQVIENARSTGSTVIPPLHVRICLSSRSLLQKLLHPQSRNGYTYPPASWHKKLGLPKPELLEAGGIHLEAKSLFFLPFSVMHPKFVFIDRQRAFVPSCNVSWESWLEGCVEITGDAVHALFAFYLRTWESLADSRQDPPYSYSHSGTDVSQVTFDETDADLMAIQSTAHHRSDFQLQETVPTLILPSSHHRNPRFRPFPWQKAPAPPDTALNIASLQLFEQAQQSIYVQTPNLTCETVLAALLDALARGVDVTIVTSRNMMLLEQLLTAGTTTSWCIRSLIRRFRRLKALTSGNDKTQDGSSRLFCDLEAGRPRIAGNQLGHLQISYFHPKTNDSPKPRERQSEITPPPPEEPVHSHLKLTLVDAEYALLGSGNMDRASWFTSQELGILFQNREVCSTIKTAVDSVLERRLDLIFNSEDM
ncbi:hypothetical protein VTI28DRAFT_4402 [Corynascus sepedonium]